MDHTPYDRLTFSELVMLAHSYALRIPHASDTGKEIALEREHDLITAALEEKLKQQDTQSSKPEIQWTPEDSAQAKNEGWILANYPKAPEIQKDDRDRRFYNDDATIIWLTRRAIQGNLLARKALLLHFHTSYHDPDGTTYTSALTDNDLPANNRK